MTRRLDDLLTGRSGVLVVVLVGIGGQIVWAFHLSGAIVLADALAMEGVIVAVVFGVLALRVAVHHEIELGRVSGRLEGVSDSILTRTVGVFPNFIPHVTELLAQAEKSVMVMCDNPAYGIVSSGDAFDAYLIELKRKIALRTSRSSFSVKLMFLASEERKELHRDQVHRYTLDQRDWEGWREMPSTRNRLEEFLKRADGICKPDAQPITDDYIEETLGNLTVDKYVECLAEVNDTVLTHHLYGAKRHVLEFRDVAGNPQARSRGPSVYFWMRDGRHAIFAIVPLGEESKQSREVAFETHDPDMIEALKGMFSRYQPAATEVPG